MPTTQYKLSSGQEIPSVTTVIDKNLGWNKDVLTRWAYKQGKQGKELYETLETAGMIGTLAHYMAECHIKGLPADEAYIKTFEKDTIHAAKIAYRSFIRWFDGTDFSPLAVEEHMVSERHGFGGTPDCVAYLNGELSIFDIKTSAGIYPDHLIQICGGYSLLWEELHPDAPIQRFDIAQFGKYLKTFTHFSVEADDIKHSAQGIFLHLLGIWKLRKKVESVLGKESL